MGNVSSNPSRLTPIVHAKIVEGAALGMPMKALSLRVKITPQQFYEWLEQGKKDCLEYEDGLTTTACQRLYEDVMYNYSEFLFKRYKILNMQADEGNQSAIKYLFEKGLPEIFGENKTVVEHTGTVENLYTTIDIPDDRKNKLIDIAIKRITDKKLLKNGN